MKVQQKYHVFFWKRSNVIDAEPHVHSFALVYSNAVIFQRYSKPTRHFRLPGNRRVRLWTVRNVRETLELRRNHRSRHGKQDLAGWMDKDNYTCSEYVRRRLTSLNDQSSFFSEQARWHSWEPVNPPVPPRLTPNPSKINS